MLIEYTCFFAPKSRQVVMTRSGWQFVTYFLIIVNLKVNLYILQVGFSLQSTIAKSLSAHCNPLQGSTGKYRENPVMIQGPCNENRVPL